MGAGATRGAMQCWGGTAREAGAGAEVGAGAASCGSAGPVRCVMACGRSVVVAQKPSKLLGRVRFPSPACCCLMVVSWLPRGVAQSGSAPGWGPGGRRFKSCLPDRRKCLEISGFWVSGTLEGGAPGEQLGNKSSRRDAWGLQAEHQASSPSVAWRQLRRLADDVGLGISCDRARP
jgi:hypothetical protein